MKARFLDAPNAGKESTEDINAWLNAAGRVSVMSQSEMLIAFKRLGELPIGSVAYNRCKQKIVERNLRLVPNFVHRYMRCKSKYKWGSAETVDFLQAGSIGLIRAVEKYDYKSGYRFSTYAMHWIRSFVGRYNMYTMSRMYIPEDTHILMHIYKTRGTEAIKEAPRYSNKKGALGLVRAGLEAKDCLLFSEVNTLEDTSIEDLIQYEPSNQGEFNDGQFTVMFENAFKAAGVTSDEIQCLRDVYILGMSASTAAKQRKMCYKRFQKLHNQAIKKLESTIDPGILEV